MHIAPRFNFASVAGDTLRLQFAATNEDGTVAILTGHTVKFAIAPLRGSAVISTEDSPPSADYDITEPLNGIFEVTVDGAYTAGLEGAHWWEAVLEDVGGGSQTVAHGTIAFSPEVV